ncbi:MAG TPA: ABC transporter ATP-binding protein [Bacteroidales bacterium]
MSDIVITVENLGKSYIIGHEKKEKYTALRDVIVNKSKRIIKKTKQLFKEGQLISGNELEEFWAIKDLNFEIKQGDRVGIIGRNGAGKSTLLKVLSRITEPTSGKVRLKGRVASLLEVGTGFHPELTGRENIFLNGAILGMSRNEVKRKFDEIVDFAEIEQFLDTPVKRYSSGMYVRLAFAVAAHLEPEILLVDEVLAVGDANFQKKCLSKMEEVSSGDGRTVLFVSHNMTSIQALCNSAIFFRKGQTAGITSVKNAVNEYLGGNWKITGKFIQEIDNFKNKSAYIIEAQLKNKENNLSESFKTYDDIKLEIKWENKDGVKVNPNFMLVNRQGDKVMLAIDTPIDWFGDKKTEKTIYLSSVIIPGNLLNSGDYTVHLALDSGSPRICYDYVPDALAFSVWDPMDENCIARGNYSHVREDVILWPALKWTNTK